uniref:Uncharacterized protein n=1 Tax=Spongospora subterranea TaxID=70186 RepID=A0A0H5QEY0_9EUKA|eukprot:CRZ00505.1 hypothetical protein [Spongospora subterranea]
MIIGVGDGIFAIALVLLISLVIAWFGAKSDRPGLFTLIALCLSFGVVFFFAVTPRQSSTMIGSDQVYDETARSRVWTVIILGIGAMMGVGSIIITVLPQPIVAKRVRNPFLQ